MCSIRIYDHGYMCIRRIKEWDEFRKKMERTPSTLFGLPFPFADTSLPTPPLLPPPSDPLHCSLNQESGASKRIEEQERIEGIGEISVFPNLPLRILMENPMGGVAMRSLCIATLSVKVNP